MIILPRTMATQCLSFLNVARRPQSTCFARHTPAHVLFYESKRGETSRRVEPRFMRPLATAGASAILMAASPRLPVASPWDSTISAWIEEQ